MSDVFVIVLALACGVIGLMVGYYSGVSEGLKKGMSFYSAMREKDEKKQESMKA